MTNQNKIHIKRLRELYTRYDDNEGLLALADIESKVIEGAELKMYRELPKTQELISKAVTRFRNCITKLTDVELNKKMTPEERAYCFAAMDWARFTLDTVGQSQEMIESEIDSLIQARVESVGGKL